MNKIFYIANYRFPTERAHGIQVAQTCQALAKAGQEVVLLIPNRHTKEFGDIFTYYNVEKIFLVKKLPVIDWLSVLPNKLTFWLESITFAFSVLFYLLKNYQKDYIYSRDQFSLYFLKYWSKFKLVYEMHNFPKKINHWHQSLFTKIKFVVISHGLQKELENIGIKNENILVAPDGVDLSFFQREESKQELRQKLNWPIDKKIVVYAGSMHTWKGVDTLLSAAKNCPEFDFYFIGEVIQKKLSEANIRFIGKQPYSLIPSFLAAADLLILPNSGKEKISSNYTSPMKLFEYLASGIPVLASDLPSIREIVSEQSVYFFQPDDSEDLARCIKNIFKNYSETEDKTSVAQQIIKKFTWQERVKNIINFIQHA